MRSNRARDRAWRNYDYPGAAWTCAACGSPFEECTCVCPFCSERDGCRCCIGLGIATGGD